MIEFLTSRSAALLPQKVTGHLGWLRGAIGAALGIACAGAITALVLKTGSVGSGNLAFVWLVAPMGASAVLVFAVPASPLAQPWPLIGGNLLSTAIGLGFGQYLGSPLLATSFGVGTAIAVMSLARCLHPPGGACALLCALGATGSEAWGWDHMLPIVFNVIVIALAGWLYNNLTGHSWPHKAKLPPAVRTSPDIPSTHEALEEVLAEWNEVLDVDVDDLDALFQALRRRINLRNSKKAE